MPSFVFLTLAGCVQNIILTGAGSIITKYFEQALNMRTEDAGYTFGKLYSNLIVKIVINML